MHTDRPISALSHAFVSQLGINFNYSHSQLKKAMAAISYVNDRTGIANTLEKSLHPQLQLVKYVGKFNYWLYFFNFLCHFIVNI